MRSSRIPARDFGGLVAARLGRRFAAGPDASDALAVAADIRSSGPLVTCEYVAHASRGPADADDAQNVIVDLLGRLGSTGLAESGAVDLLLGMGPLGEGNDGVTRLRSVATAAAAAGTRITLRPDSPTDVDRVLATAAALRPEYPEIGVELWAAMRRTAGDLAELLGEADSSTPGPRVLLRVSGDGIRVPAPLALAATDVERAFVRYTKRLVRSTARAVIAAPDATLRAIVEAIGDAADTASGTPRTAAGWELLTPLGLRGDEAERLALSGRRVRVSVPFGPRCGAVGLRRFSAARAPRVTRGLGR